MIVTGRKVVSVFAAGASSCFQENNIFVIVDGVLPLSGSLHGFAAWCEPVKRQLAS